MSEETPKTVENGNTVDKNSGLEIRLTDNGLKEKDMEAPSVARPLTQEEIEVLLASVSQEEK